MKRKVLWSSLLIVGMAVSALMWVNFPVDEIDPSLAGASESYTCSKCGKVFDVPLSEATAKYRNEQAITCSACGGAANKTTPVRTRRGIGVLREKPATSIHPASAPAEDQDAPASEHP